MSMQFHAHKAAIAAYARQKMDLHGLKDWTLVWDNAKRRAGVCRPRRFQIGLSAFLLAHHGEAIDWHDVVLHEIAHAVDFLERGRSDHSRAWKMVAMRIGAAPERCLDTVGLAPVPTKWTLRCAKGHTFHRHKRARQGILHSCPKCAPGRFSHAHPLEWINNSAKAAPAYLSDQPKDEPMEGIEIRAAEALCRMMRSVYGDAAIDAAALINLTKPPKGGGCATSKLDGPRAFEVLMDAWVKITGELPDFDDSEVTKAFDDAFTLARDSGYNARRVEEIAGSL